MDLQYELERLNTSVKRIEREMDETKRWYEGDEQKSILAGLEQDLKEVQEEIAQLEANL
jgi:peptidoglycan hydrolase CwlO-like protein